MENTGSIMVNIIMISIIMIFFLGYVYCKYVGPASVDKRRETNKQWYIWVLLLVGLVIQVIMSAQFEGFRGDINCFKAWGNKVLDKGFSGMYVEGDFTDYPPGYLYVLGVLAGICRTFGIESETVSDVIFKLPACICDLATGYLIYKMAKRKFSEDISVLCAAIYIFNPAIMVNSSVWGQVDAVYALAVVAMCYFIVEKKLPLAYVAFALGILVKPQMVFFAPVLIWGIVDQVFLDGFEDTVFCINLASGLASILMMFLLMWPFGVQKVVDQYLATITSYPRATVNAYNLWAMFGLNWQPQEETFLKIQYSQWGTLFIILIVIAAFYLFYKSKKDDSKYFFIAGFIVTSIFMLSVRMHERYMFPALALILLAFILKPMKEIFYSYIGLSVVHFLNVAHVLYYYDPQNFSRKAMIPMIIAALSVGMLVYLLYTAYKWYIVSRSKQDLQIQEQETLRKESLYNHKKKKWIDEIRPSDVIVRITKWDILILLGITIIYGAIALYDLGDRDAPETEWYLKQEEATIVLDMGEGTKVKKIAYYLGNYERRNFTVETATDLNGEWTKVTDLEMSSVFCWGEKDASIQDRYIRLICSNDVVSIFELALIDSEGNTILPSNYNEYPELFDEQDLYAERTFRNGTYFDEIYHARTAYEFIQGRRAYENTHPPLGKGFIALGMSIFGVNPFGWRIIGTLFGIAMLPFIYLFAKRFFKETWIASIVTVLFSFDFMHFTQTRIATIDVYITFFIIIMYYFMYRYTTMSFYDTKLVKTFIPLGLSGIAMGFGIASKWTGVYAGLGLAVIFFATLYRRYREYGFAKERAKGSSNGISHRDVIDKFPKYTSKTILFCIVFFAIIPITIYTLSYLPFKEADVTNKSLIVQMIENQNNMYSYHSKLESTHVFSSTWYQWPVIYRPIYYYARQVSDTVSEGISAFGNPLVWWAGIPAFIYMVHLAWKEKDKKALFLVIAYLAQYIPWMAVSRTTYIYHYFTCVPFVVMMIGYSMYKIVEKKPKWKTAMFAYTVAAVGLFVVFYPVISGHAVVKQFVIDWLKWFDSWVLIS